MLAVVLGAGACGNEFARGARRAPSLEAIRGREGSFATARYLHGYGSPRPTGNAPEADPQRPWAESRLTDCVTTLGENLLQIVAACVSVLFWGGLLVWSLRRDPRALRNGFLLIVFAYNLVGFGAVLASSSPALELEVGVISLAVTGAVALGFLALPLLLVIDGVLMIRRESRSLGNSLALMVGLALMLLPVALAALLRHENPVTGSVAVGLLTAQACAGICFLAFAAHTALYAWIARRSPARAVIVLGSGLVRGAVPPLLAARLERAVTAAEERRETDGRPVFVPSGGQGRDEPRPEGEVMGEWLRQRGIDDADILVEDRARTTRENLLYSVQLLERHGVPAPYLVVTNNYHAPRAAMLARALGIDAQVVGAPTAWYFWPSAYLREFIAAMLERRVLVFLSGGAVAGMVALVWWSLSAT
ncbi:YdcF family protein [Solirubrobacter sp. CPCC 204708]|uniref:YdcF family protein n=1 Tax=Solirubrobacter deserti TaxID=2282478 RepID=A0ABT4RJM8_9ACTN|nr:YdcF family protein [Solirubrobacter deserti]MBE2320910.1 YdcF family protein [Solirubrobacter deserti]MDA0138546.1 YdcF family protein [Solirubrobacter deserti]